MIYVGYILASFYNAEILASIISKKIKISWLYNIFLLYDEFWGKLFNKYYDFQLWDYINDGFSLLPYIKKIL